MTSPSSMDEIGHPKLAHWDNPEGWDREGGGMEVGDVHVHTWASVADSCQCMEKTTKYSKVISLQLKYIN